MVNVAPYIAFIISVLASMVLALRGADAWAWVLGAGFACVLCAEIRAGFALGARVKDE